MPNLRVLLTGERGFLGKSVHSALAGDSSLEVEKLGRRLSELRRGELAGFDVVVHLAGWIPKSAGAPDLQRALDANVIGFKTLLDALEPRPQRLLFASSVDVYGATTRDTLDERSLVNPEGVYAASKLLGERMLAEDERERGYRGCAMRIGHLYGPGEEAFAKLVPTAIRALMKGRPPTVVGDGETRRDLLYVDDAAEAIHRLVLVEEPPELLNVAAPETHSLNEIAEALIGVVGFLGDIRHLSDRPNPPSLAFDASLLSRTVGDWTRVSLREGLRREVEHFVALERGTEPAAR